LPRLQGVKNGMAFTPMQHGCLPRYTRTTHHGRTPCLFRSAGMARCSRNCQCGLCCVIMRHLWMAIAGPLCGMADKGVRDVQSRL
jgi:hypothetical protein